MNVRSSVDANSYLQGGRDSLKLSLEGGIQLSGSNGQFNTIYFDLPPLVKGNQLKSYGGHLSFNIDTGGDFLCTRSVDATPLTIEDTYSYLLNKSPGRDNSQGSDHDVITPKNLKLIEYN